MEQLTMPEAEYLYRVIVESHENAKRQLEGKGSGSGGTVSLEEAAARKLHHK